MPVFLLDERLVFPPPQLAEDGLLAVGGDLSPERLELAYSQGIFPWYSEDEPILWHSPDPRMVLVPEKLRVSRRLQRTLRSGRFALSMDTAFRRVVEACASVPRPGQRGTWITAQMIDAYTELHRRGIAHSIEAWSDDGELAGGVYGVSLGAAFFGESMFSHVTDASKVAFVRLTQQIHAWRFAFLDCQIYTEHLERFGAENWPRERFLAALREALGKPTRRGRWRLS
ncbi:MAG: leucyl/phenylalanyl-tRNA--protein transferase [Acidobacteriota bacterium]|nr:MAG: leucyl/phenylalanyl-tRNA--protein transferase [Acidobacteriota bacterium]